MPFQPITDEQYEAGLASGRESLAKATVAQSVRYDGATDRLTVALEQCDIVIPRSRIGEFAGISAEDMARVRLSAVGDAIAVASHDVHVDLGGLLADILPEAAVSKAFAKRGGQATSRAKARAARTNGLKGGRPRKNPAAIGA